ncbi:MAG: osmotically-inducible protein OsmY [Arenicella sp.]|jgi:osmotically-inducible protein OsmY
MSKSFAAIIRTSIISLIATITLSGCLTAIVATAAIATIDIIHDRRTVGEYIDDSAIEVTARNILISTAEIRKATHFKTQSWNGILLITGEIDSETLKPALIEKLSSIQGVRQVVDETSITGKTRLWARTNDALITSRVKTRLLLKTGLSANRVKVVTTRGSVYLMGIVTRAEADRATEYTQTVRGVKRVVKVFEYKESN